MVVLDNTINDLENKPAMKSQNLRCRWDLSSNQIPSKGLQKIPLQWSLIPSVKKCQMSFSGHNVKQSENSLTLLTWGWIPYWWLQLRLSEMPQHIVQRQPKRPEKFRTSLGQYKGKTGAIILPFCETSRNSLSSNAA